MKRLLPLLLITAFTAGATELQKTTEEAALQEKGNWIRVSGVIDSLYDEDNYRLKDETGVIEIEQKAHGMKVDDSCSVLGILDPSRRGGNLLESRLTTAGGTVLFEYKQRHALPDIYENSASNRILYNYRKRNVTLGSTLLALGGVSFVATTISLGSYLKGKREHEESAEERENYSSMSPMSPIDLSGLYVIDGYFALASAGITLYSGILGGIYLSKGLRTPELKLKANTPLSLNVHLIPNPAAPGIGITGTF